MVQWFHGAGFGISIETFHISWRLWVYPSGFWIPRCKCHQTMLPLHECLGEGPSGSRHRQLLYDNWRSFDIEMPTLCDTEELFQLYDRYLRDFPNMSKRQAEEEEKFFGWNVDPASLMAKPDLRPLLSLKHLMLDSCHCYFSNGCVSQEIVLFMNYLGNEHSVQLEDIQKAAIEVKWNYSNPDYRSPSAIGHLFHPSLWSGTCHKGEATASWYLLPLLGFYGFELLEGQDPLEWQSFKALFQADLLFNTTVGKNLFKPLKFITDKRMNRVW